MKYNTNIFIRGTSENNLISFLFTTGFMYIIYYIISSIIISFILYYNNFKGNEYEEKLYSAILATFILLIHIYYEIIQLIPNKTKGQTSKK